MRQKFLNLFAGVFFGACCAVLFGIGNAPASKNETLKHQTPLELNLTFSGITKVIDGDSIKVDGNEVRLLGLDAPEYKQTCLNADNTEYNCGQISKKFLFNLANDKETTCYYAHKDMYHRFLAKCYIGKISINEEIVKNGMAVIYDYKNSDEKMDGLELNAKTAKIGIWQGAFQLPKEYRKSHKKSHH
jgi:endonuclease YncB( thermonuclease family)